MSMCIYPVVLFCSDVYVKYCANVVISIIENFSPYGRVDKIEFIICGYKISRDNKEKFYSLVNKFGFDVLFVDLDDIADAFKDSVSLNPSETLTKDTDFYRFCLPKLLLPFVLPHFEKFLYIDCDCFVRSNIASIFEIDLGSNFAGMVEDVANTLHSKRLFGKPSSSYYNCGVILFNSRKILEYYDIDIFYRLIMSNMMKYQIPDQDLFNVIFKSKILAISTKWNHHHSFHRAFHLFTTTNPLDYERNKDNPVIVHYVGKDKIWLDSCNRPFKEEYKNVMGKNPFFN